MKEGLSKLGESRRRLIKAGAGLAAAALVTAKIGVELRSISSDPPRRVTKELSGIIPNCHRLPYIEDEQVRERFIRSIETSGAACTRVFLDDDFEPALGDYHLQKVEEIVKLSQRIPLVVDLFDAFYLLHADDNNPGFGPSRLKSPYLINEAGRSLPQQQMAVFTDKEVRRMFMNRIGIAAEALRDVPGVKGLSVANELNIRMRDVASSRSLHSDFYQEAIETIEATGWRGPIMLGIDDPELINEERFTHYTNPVINTIHIYPGTVYRIGKYKSQPHFLPLVCQEVGIPRIGPLAEDVPEAAQSYDLECSRFITSTMWRLSPLISAIGPWRFSAEGDSHHDNYEIVIKEMPLTLKAIHESGIQLVS